MLNPAILRRRRWGGNPIAAYAAGGESPAFVLDPVAGFYAANGVRAAGLSDIATFARASAQRYRNSSGLLASVASGSPALGHHIWRDGAYANAGLLIEPAVPTNYVTEPENFSHGFWTKVAAASTAVDATGPDGTVSATTLVAANAGGESATYVGANVSGFATSTVHTWSIFAKAGTLNWTLNYLTGFTTPMNGGWYGDLTNLVAGGTQGVVTGMTVYAERYSADWLRLHIIATTNIADTTGQPRAYIAEANGDFNVPQNGSSSVRIYGAQFHAGPPSGYIGTTARAATSLTIAAADLPYSGAGMSGKFDGTVTVGAQTLFDWRADASNRITLSVNGSGSVTLTMVNGGATASVTATDTIPLGIHEEATIAWYVSGSSIGVSLDGAKANEQATAIGIPDLSAAGASVGENGTLAELSLWGTNIGASGIEEASAAGFFI